MPTHQSQSKNERKTTRHNPFAVFSSGTVIGILGGLIGLGGAEFRLPLLIGVFGFGALEAVMLNKAMSLVVVASALPFRAATVPFSSVLERYDVLVTLLSGSIVGAWLGAGWAIRLRSQRLYRVIAVLLVGIAAVLLWGHGLSAASTPLVHGWLLTSVGVLAGVGIGVVAALLGVAGGELLIPTVMLLFGADLKLAGSISLAVSLPTMITSFTRYSRDRNFVVIRKERRFIVIMAAGSLVGAYVGGLLLGIIPTPMLLPILAAILAISAVKVWRHK
ncbi:MAG: Sulfite exporter TauE/SafE [Syntrophorhabdaceae bacterium PtaU1.Bin034]|nr:MAG: Sulfite exporter TauE/SafE [Syntrophorhabdaceae bacterium PtaU1.Bin034]